MQVLAGWAWALVQTEAGALQDYRTTFSRRCREEVSILRQLFQRGVNDIGCKAARAEGVGQQPLLVVAGECRTDQTPMSH